MIKEFKEPEQHLFGFLNRWEYKKTELYLRLIEYQQWQCDQEINNPYQPASMIKQYVDYKEYLEQQRIATIKYRLQATI